MRASPLVALAAALAGCQSGGTPTAATPAPSAYSVPGVTPSTFHMPTGGGCSGEVARFQAVIDNDLASGHTTQGVRDRVSAEIAQARSSCSAGNEAGAIAQIRATKAKFGYPG